MIITDTLGTAFEKFSTDIVQVDPLPMTQNLNEYILTIQDNFTKYSLAMSLLDSLASIIADALIKKFIIMYF